MQPLYGVYDTSGGNGAYIGHAPPLEYRTRYTARWRRGTGYEVSRVLMLRSVRGSRCDYRHDHRLCGEHDDREEWGRGLTPRQDGALGTTCLCATAPYSPGHLHTQSHWEPEGVLGDHRVCATVSSENGSTPDHSVFGRNPLRSMSPGGQRSVACGIETKDLRDAPNASDVCSTYPCRQHLGDNQ